MEFVRIEKGLGPDGRVAVVRFDRGDGINALSPQALRELTAAARSFLHHQVRSMVGCLAIVGRGQWKADHMRKALEARDRAALGLNAPPHGLYFVEALYP